MDLNTPEGRSSYFEELLQQALEEGDRRAKLGATYSPRHIKKRKGNSWFDKWLRRIRL